MTSNTPIHDRLLSGLGTGTSIKKTVAVLNKGNNKITEFRTILQRESQNSSVYKQTKSVNNRKTVKTVMTLTWYRHFLRNGGLNQILN